LWLEAGLSPSRRRWLGLVVATASLAMVSGIVFAADPSPTLAKREWSVIKQVIAAQREALKKGDSRRAYGFATRGIQQQFGDAENFMRMVQTSYTPLLDARYAEFLDGAVIDGNVIQPLRLILPDNTVLVALYTMEKEKGRWHIAGCVLAPSTVQAT
jgi:hypothetical protein